MKACIKISYELAEVREEIRNLIRSNPELEWRKQECAYCKGWHVVRIRPPGYVSDESKKAIALWKERKLEEQRIASQQSDD